LYFAVYYIIIIFYPRQSLFSAHTHTTHNNSQLATQANSASYPQRNGKWVPAKVRWRFAGGE